MSPPPRNGGIDSSSSRRAHSDPGAGWAQRLVAAEHVEVAADPGDVDRQVRHRLRPVHEHERAGLMGLAGHLHHRVDGAQRVGRVGERDQLRLEAEQDLEDVLAQDAVVRDRDELEVRVLLLGQDLPRDEVRVVLHLGQDDHVPAADVAPTPRVRDEVDRLGGIAGPDDLARVRGPDQLRDLRPRALVGLGGPLGDLVDPAVDVRVVLAVVRVHGLDDGQRLLRGGRRVEIDQAVPVHLLAEDREVRPERDRIERGQVQVRLDLAGRGGHRHRRLHRRHGRLSWARRVVTGRRRPPRAPGEAPGPRRGRRSRARSRAGSGRSPPPPGAAQGPCRRR